MQSKSKQFSSFLKSGSFRFILDRVSLNKSQRKKEREHRKERVKGQMNEKESFSLYRVYQCDDRPSVIESVWS